MSDYLHLFENTEYKYAICKIEDSNMAPVGMFFSKNDLKIYYLANKDTLGDVVIVNRLGHKLKIKE
jgi:hypothetical protein